MRGGGGAGGGACAARTHIRRARYGIRTHVSAARRRCGVDTSVVFGAGGSLSSPKAYRRHLSLPLPIFLTCEASRCYPFNLCASAPNTRLKRSSHRGVRENVRKLYPTSPPPPRRQWWMRWCAGVVTLQEEGRALLSRDDRTTSVFHHWNAVDRRPAQPPTPTQHTHVARAHTICGS